MFRVVYDSVIFPNLQFITLTSNVLILAFALGTACLHSYTRRRLGWRTVR